jgi:hypothetical protein
MMTNPRIGQRVQCWHRESLRPIAPLHGRVGTVVVRARGGRRKGEAKRVRNHGVEIDGRLFVVPYGHLRKPPEGGLF